VGTRRYTIKELPPELRPRERLLSEGPEALSGAELLAILLGTGSKEDTAVALAGQVISESGDLFGLHGVSIQVRKHKTASARVPRPHIRRRRAPGAG
jgi:DNA repair protein RadC